MEKARDKHNFLTNLSINSSKQLRLTKNKNIYIYYICSRKPVNLYNSRPLATLSHSEGPFPGLPVCEYQGEHRTAFLRHFQRKDSFLIKKLISSSLPIAPPHSLIAPLHPGNYISLRILSSSPSLLSLLHHHNQHQDIYI